GRDRPLAVPVRVDEHLPLLLRLADGRARARHRHHGDGRLRQHEAPQGLRGHDQLLRSPVPHQLRRRRRDRHRAGVPVRHELERVLALRRQHLRRPAGARGAHGVLPREHVHRALVVRQGPAHAVAAPGEHLAGGDRHAGQRVLGRHGQRLDAPSRRLRDRRRASRPHRLHGPDVQSEGAAVLRARAGQRLDGRRLLRARDQRLPPAQGTGHAGLQPVAAHRAGVRRDRHGVLRDERPRRGAAGPRGPADEVRGDGGAVGDLGVAGALVAVRAHRRGRAREPVQRRDPGPGLDPGRQQPDRPLRRHDRAERGVPREVRRDHRLQRRLHPAGHAGVLVVPAHGRHRLAPAGGRLHGAVPVVAQARRPRHDPVVPRRAGPAAPAAVGGQLPRLDRHRARAPAVHGLRAAHRAGGRERQHRARGPRRPRGPVGRLPGPHRARHLPAHGHRTRRHPPEAGGAAHGRAGAELRRRRRRQRRRGLPGLRAEEL
ncbi:MAG: Cytochrome bd terminal oxidase subunit I, partial [uncultured Friedmanniella sp.]